MYFLSIWLIIFFIFLYIAHYKNHNLGLLTNVQYKSMITAATAAAAAPGELIPGWLWRLQRKLLNTAAALTLDWVSCLG